jgi:hypothetical protein
MALRETEQLTRMITAAALSRAICTIGELGVARPDTPSREREREPGRERHERRTKPHAPAGSLLAARCDARSRVDALFACAGGCRDRRASHALSSLQHYAPTSAAHSLAVGACSHGGGRDFEQRSGSDACALLPNAGRRVGVGSCPCLFGRSAGGERCVRSEARIRATRRHQISRVGIGSSHDHWRADVCYVGSNAGGYSHAASIFSNRFRAISITSTLSSAHSHSALMGTHRDCPTSVRP